MKTTGDNWEADVVIQTADESDNDDEQEIVAPVINRRTASIYADTLLRRSDYRHRMPPLSTWCRNGNRSCNRSSLSSAASRTASWITSRRSVA